MEVALIVEAKPFITLANLSSGSKKKRQVSSCPFTSTDILSQAAIYLSSCSRHSTAETLELKLSSWHLSLYRVQSGQLGVGCKSRSLERWLWDLGELQALVRGGAGCLPIRHSGHSVLAPRCICNSMRMLEILLKLEGNKYIHLHTNTVIEYSFK